MSYSTTVEASLRKHDAMTEEGRTRHTGRDDRATTEQVLDPRTRFILYRMLNKGLFHHMNGCLSTGKEANVYHAVNEDGSELAIKVYKTSILIFKDRERYVSGDYRFRRGYCKSNPRKMVAMWAEKERRNLQRLYDSGLPVPFVKTQTQNVLVMEFLGENGWPSPRLKDVTLSISKLTSLYHQLIILIRRMYLECGLIHGDLSEYNMLYHKKQIYIIDVSQSVEREHPNSLFFLRNDLKNITDYFLKSNIEVMTTKELFDFVTNASIKEENYDSYIEDCITKSKSLLQTGEYESEERVFMQSYIPRSLFEVDNIDIEKDIEKLKNGDSSEIFYKLLTGMNEVMEKRKEQLQLNKNIDEGEEIDEEEDDNNDNNDEIEEVIDEIEDNEFENDFKKNYRENEIDKVLNIDVNLDEDKSLYVSKYGKDDDNDDNDDDNDSDEDNSDSDEEKEEKDKEYYTYKNSTKEERKEHKKQVKAERAEKRKQKVPKKIKKRAEKITKQRR
ncbi:hypothetical protein WA158_003445 [Blastocystis sp. Blastoise]